MSISTFPIWCAVLWFILWVAAPAKSETITSDPTGAVVRGDQPYHYVQIQRGVWVKRPVKLPYSEVPTGEDLERMYDLAREHAQGRLAEVEGYIASAPRPKRRVSEIEHQLSGPASRVFDVVTYAGIESTDVETLYAAAIDIKQRDDIRSSQPIRVRLNRLAEAQGAGLSVPELDTRDSVEAASASMAQARDERDRYRKGWLLARLNEEASTLRRILELPELAN